MIAPVPPTPESQPAVASPTPSGPGFENALRTAEASESNERPKPAGPNVESDSTEDAPTGQAPPPSVVPALLIALPQLAATAASPGVQSGPRGAVAVEAGVATAASGAARLLTGIEAGPAGVTTTAHGTVHASQVSGESTAETEEPSFPVPPQPSGTDDKPVEASELQDAAQPANAGPKTAETELNPSGHTTNAPPQTQPQPAPEPRAALAAVQHATAQIAPPHAATPQPQGEPTRAASPQAPPPAEQVAPVILAQAIRPGAPARTIIELRPAELGRVEVAVETRRDGPAEVRIVAERPEALAALQRDRPALEAALRSAGFEGQQATLSFDLGGDRRPPPERAAPTAPARATGEPNGRGSFALASEAGRPRLSHRLLDLAL
jgi:hypothetical protein